jgi:anti-sigma factor ChrR (cupin superfamily)
MTHQISELAADYALGALGEEEARLFEKHLEAGCEACRRDYESYKGVAAALAFAVEAQTPRSRLRKDLARSLNDARYGSIRAEEGEWTVKMPGIAMKHLHTDPKSGISTSLVRMSPGASLPRHRHLGVEQFLVLEGDCNVNDERLGPGDFHFAEPGSVHESTNTQNGTLFLLVADQNYQFDDI